MAKAVDKAYLFERMPVKRAVLKQIVPTIIGQMIVLIYNLADTYFVGLLNEPRQTAAVTVVGPVFVMLTAVSNLFAVGGASVMAHAMGLKDETRARQVSSLAFWGGLIAAVIFSALFYALASPILRLCGATDETYALAFGYAKWVVIWGGAGTILNLLLGNLVRAEGGAMVAAFGVALCTLIGGGALMRFTGLFAFAFSIAAVLIVLTLSHTHGRVTTVSLLLAGIAVSSLLTALTSGLMVIDRENLENVYMWTMGSFTSSSWDKLKIAAPVILKSIDALMQQAYPSTLFKQGRAYNILIDDKLIGSCMIRFVSLYDTDAEYYVGHKDYTALEISYLAIDSRIQGHGYGRLVLKQLILLARRIADDLPVRFLVLDAFKDKEEWYIYISRV